MELSNKRKFMPISSSIQIVFSSSFICCTQKMNLADFVLGSIPLMLQLYSEMYRNTDYRSTMSELESEHNVPKMKTYDFIVGKLSGFSSSCSNYFMRRLTVLLITLYNL